MVMMRLKSSIKEHNIDLINHQKMCLLFMLALLVLSFTSCSVCVPVNAFTPQADRSIYNTYYSQRRRVLPVAFHSSLTTASCVDSEASSVNKTGGSTLKKMVNNQTPLSFDCSSIHLISLPPLSEKSSKIVKDLWKWKDIVLGDGRDYFIPRPRALKALGNILVGSSFIIHHQSQSFESIHNYTLRHSIDECAILSNCARMDILLSVSTNVTISNKNVLKLDIAEEALEASSLLVANCLLDQLSSYQNMQKDKGSGATLWEGISSFLDLPGMVVTDAQGGVDDNNIITEERDISIDEIQENVRELSDLMSGESKLNEIILHFCLIAAGLAKRDSRPDRVIAFRPFSSRDAHIMLQLKRTVEVAMEYSRVKTILDTALNAGKASRDVNKVPILKQLKKYDCEGKYSTPAPLELAEIAIDDVKELAIQPAIDRCISKLSSQQNVEQISSFKAKVDKVIEDQELQENPRVKRLTHETIVQIRNGINVDIDEVLSQIYSERPK